ncbi:MAG: putative 7-carboxy-7-deazaguanine synthase QueE [Oscillospiraceae bacterium]|nr:putative 7-carboxy-7-deazaguanine synthase QueE [Oscillospiraceae bacterium]
MGTFQLAEQFVSINGEGQHAGKLALFLRFAGCNLQCRWCDTMWANQADAPCTPVTEQALCNLAKEAGIRHVTITGGEPLLQNDFAALAAALGEAGFLVEVETNGSVLLPLFETHRPSYTMDYKLPSSGMESQMCLENFSRLIPTDTLKFVCGSREDLERMAEIVEEYQLIGKCQIFISPVFGSIEPADIVDFMKEYHLEGIRLQLQLHKMIWPPDARGV